MQFSVNLALNSRVILLGFPMKLSTLKIFSQYFFESIKINIFKESGLNKNIFRRLPFFFIYLILIIFLLKNIVLIYKDCFNQN